MASDKGSPASGKPLGPIPRGIEVLVKKAAVDPEFKRLLLEKRAEAASEIGLVLDPAEALMLAAAPTAQLEAIIAQTTVAPALQPVFMGRAATVMLAALGVGVVAAGVVSLTVSAGQRALEEARSGLSVTDSTAAVTPTAAPSATATAPATPTVPRPSPAGIPPGRPPMPAPTPTAAPTPTTAPTPSAAPTATPTAPYPPVLEGIRPDRPRPKPEPTPTAPAPTPTTPVPTPTTPPPLETRVYGPLPGPAPDYQGPTLTPQPPDRLPGAGGARPDRP